jgi:hypothetical protein
MNAALFIPLPLFFAAQLAGQYSTMHKRMRTECFRCLRQTFSVSRRPGNEKSQQTLEFTDFLGGDEEDRTLDLTDANRTLSQLSYAPILWILHKFACFHPCVK